MPSARSEQVDSPLQDVGTHSGMSRVEVAHCTVAVARENGNGGVLRAFPVFAAQIVFEGVGTGAQQTQSVPTSLASERAQRRQIGGGGHREVEILREMMRDTVGAVQPGCAHGARHGLLFAEHEVIDNEGAIGLGEEFAQPDGAHRLIARIEVARTFFKLVVLDGSALRQMAARSSA